jgi:pyrroloquinoline quinone biosynthesis protein D
MSELPAGAVPRLARGCRLSKAEGQENMLLIPEGALKLQGPSRAIVALCDGERTVAGIIAELQQRFPAEDPQRIEREVIAFLTRLRDKRVIECEAE